MTTTGNSHFGSNSQHRLSDQVLAGALTETDESQAWEMLIMRGMAQEICVVVSDEDRARLEAIVGDRNRLLKHVQ